MRKYNFYLFLNSFIQLSSIHIDYFIFIINNSYLFAINISFFYYSEDAKLMWNKWVKEDANAFISDAKDQREMLLQQLEEEWRGLAENDKQRLTHTYNNVMTGSSLQNELKLISEKLSG